MSSGTGLPPHDHAAFAVTSRLISCIVTEQLLPAIYISTPRWQQASGIMLVLSAPDPLGRHPLQILRVVPAEGIFAIVPLRQAPVFQQRQMDRKTGKLVELVDPLDMQPRAFILRPETQSSSKAEAFTLELAWLLKGSPCDFPDHVLHETLDPLVFWNKFADIIQVAEPTRSIIEKEVSSSLYHQYLSYRSPPRCPTIRSPSIQWEQSLVAGHPTHPMHRARLHPSADLRYDWYHPSIRFVRVPRTHVDLKGSFESISRAMITKALKNQARNLDHETFIYVPVHELQIPNIVKLFTDVAILPPEVHLKAKAQTSIRTVSLKEFPGYALKLAVGVKISSSLRTISHWTADFGPRFSEEIVPRLAIDHTILTIETEPASAIHRSGAPDVRKHFTAVLRKEYQPGVNENVIIVAALLETDHANTDPGTAAVSHVFGLDSDSKRIAFLDRYIELSCKALLPALIYNGVAFEAHAQNVMVRVNTSSGMVTGFVIRDLGGLRIHPPTLCKSTGVDFKFLPEHCISTERLQDIYPKLYHTYVHNHIQRLIRLLGLHNNGVGWELLRRHMNAVIPIDHELRKLWLSPESSTVESKCLMRMRLQDSYRNNIYRPLPNMIQYRPDQVDGRKEYML